MSTETQPQACSFSASLSSTASHTYFFLCVIILCPVSSSASPSLSPCLPLWVTRWGEKYVCEKMSLICQTVGGEVFWLNRLPVHLSSLVSHACYFSRSLSSGPTDTLRKLLQSLATQRAFWLREAQGPRVLLTPCPSLESCRRAHTNLFILHGGLPPKFIFRGFFALSKSNPHIWSAFIKNPVFSDASTELRRFSGAASPLISQFLLLRCQFWQTLMNSLIELKAFCYLYSVKQTHHYRTHRSVSQTNTFEQHHILITTARETFPAMAARIQEFNTLSSSLFTP